MTPMLSGCHCPNGPITPQDLYIIRTAGFQVAKLLVAEPQFPTHTPLDVEKLRSAGVGEVIVRLPDSVKYFYDDAGQKILDSNHLPKTEYPSPSAYADWCLDVIEDFYAVGVRIFGVDNEPQYNWYKKYGTEEFGPFNYQNFLRPAIEKIRYLAHDDVKLVSPPLSWSPALWHHDDSYIFARHWVLDDWKAAFTFTDKGKVPSLLSMFDYCGCNCYYQSESQMQNPSFGYHFEQMHNLSGKKPIILLEWGSSLCDHRDANGNPPPPEEVEAFMRATYPRYLSLLDDSGFVEAACVFIVGGQGWGGFEVSEATARKIGQWVRNPKSYPFLQVAGGGGGIHPHQL